MNIKKAVGFVSLALASIALVACSGKQDDKNTLTIGVMTKRHLIKPDGIRLKSC